MAREGALRITCSTRSILRPAERNEERVTLRVDLVTSMSAESVA